jgi:hypothetical protein
MISPARAPVKPRVISPETGEAVPLEDEIQFWIDAGSRGSFVLLARRVREKPRPCAIWPLSSPKAPR